MIDLPENVKTIIARLHEKGFEGYAVGGCVRDALLGKQPNDWDITTNASPEEMKRCFEGCRLIETGLKHGTLTVMLGKEGYEITTYRVDGTYTDHRRPDSVRFVDDLREDLSRRDFTVNAMATADGREIVDLFGGREDLKNGILRCVGEAQKRFDEDALRILRALRFASTYDLEIEPETAKAALSLRATLKNVSEERIFSELKKLLCGKGCERILLRFPEIVFTILPELAPMLGFAQNNPHHAYDVWTHTAKTVAFAPAEPAYRLAMLFHDSGKPAAHTVDEDGVDHFKLHQLISAQIAETCLLRLKSDTATLRQVCFLVREHDLRIPNTEKAVKKQMIRLGSEGFLSLLPVFRADLMAQNPAMIPEKAAHIDELEKIARRLLSENACLKISQLAVNGNDLKSVGISGKDTGEMLKRLLNEVALSGVKNDRETLLSLAQSIKNGDGREET
ncbi:MAG: HD domain-containing protein [Clostridia bacterium]|nr:HD domain-containing protein [Clostridia bacterium]